jgi:hypothetical protein
MAQGTQMPNGLATRLKTPETTAQITGLLPHRHPMHSNHANERKENCIQISITT